MVDRFRPSFVLLVGYCCDLTGDNGLLVKLLVCAMKCAHKNMKGYSK